MIVILNYYQTAIFSNLVAPSYYKIPFRNRNELSARLLQGKVFMTDIKRRRPYCAYQCGDLYKALEKNPMKVRNTDAEVFRDISNNGVFQSKLDVNFIPSQFNWFSKRYDKIIIKDNLEVTHYTAFAFAKSQRKLRKKFDQALLKLLPAVEQITTAHGYRTRRRPFNPIQERHFFALSIREHFLQVFLIYIIGISLAFIIFLIEIFVYSKTFKSIATFLRLKT
uniref:Uncharacterized protein n=1 Tax=Panagrolaimus sp. PS1159 TaxID=55785 RepID=A0AC35F6Z2_9BILA